MPSFSWLTSSDRNDEQNSVFDLETGLRSNSLQSVDDPKTNPEASAVKHVEVLLVAGDAQVQTIDASLAKQFAEFDLQLSGMLEQAQVQELKLSESKEDVEAMLKVLCTPVQDKNDHNFSIETLIPALHMATKYKNRVLRYRVVCILELKQEEIPPARRIELARTCDVPAWIRKAVHELGGRGTPLTPEEDAMIGPDLVESVTNQHKRDPVKKTPFQRVLVGLFLLNVLVTPLSAVAVAYGFNTLIGSIAVETVSILCYNIPFVLVLPLALIFFGKSTAENRWSAIAKVLFVLLVALPGLLALRDSIAYPLEYLIINVLWPFDLHYFAPFTNLVMFYFALLETAYFYGSKSFMGWAGSLMDGVQHREPVFVPWPSQCPVCKHVIGECKDKDCWRCKGGRTLYN